MRKTLIDRIIFENARVRLLYGPLGSGKTALLADCARHAGSIEISWLALHGRAIDAPALFARIYTALTGDSRYTDESQLIDALVNKTTRHWIMLDDYPHALDSPLDRALGSLLTLHTPNINWWISCRRIPDCNLPRLLIENELFELGPDSLFFSVEELQTLLDTYAPALVAGSAHQLYETTHGWCAAIGLQLAQLERNRPRSSLHDLSGTCLLNNYLRRELLDELPDYLDEALKVMALLVRFDERLCEHLLGAAPQSSWIEILSSHGVLIQPLSGNPGWYCLLPIISTELARLTQSENSKSVHLKACQWLSDHGELRLAIDHALAAGRAQQAAGLLERLGSIQLIHGHQVVKVLEWSNSLPEELLYSTPDLVLINALTLALTFQDHEGLACLERLSAFLPGANALLQRRLLATYQALKGLLSFAQPNAAMIQQENCQQAIEHLTTEDWVLKQACCLTLVRQHLFFGDLGMAQQLLHSARRSVRGVAMDSALALVEIYQANVLMVRGELEAADQLIELQWQRIGNSPLNRSPIAGRINLSLGQLRVRRGELKSARQHFLAGYQIAFDNQDPIAFVALVELAQMALLDEDLIKASDLLSQAEKLAKGRNLAEVCYRSLVDLVTSQLLILRGDYLSAQTLLNKTLARHRGSEPMGQPYCDAELLFSCELLLAWIDSRTHRQSAAKHRLELMLGHAMNLGFLAIACEIVLALADCALTADDFGEAENRLRQGLEMASQMQLKLPVEKLQRTRPELFALLAHEKNLSMISERETAVLRLVAEGHSNQEISTLLFISIFTVKSHIQRLSAKLGVKRRTQAVAKAKSLGILS